MNLLKIQNIETTYFGRFKNWVALNEVLEERQTRALLAVAGPKIFVMAKALLNDKDQTTVSINIVQDLVSYHFCLEPLVMSERYNFLSAERQIGESIKDFALRIQKINEF
ncbi:hypothetical protein HZS_227 [Henneguya salminicola]|nr:hypothetical protein HZS_227 [Henneguya salminicola]